MSVLETLEQYDLHMDSQIPYGYRFGSISAYMVDWQQNIDVSNELNDTHNWHHIDIPQDSAHGARILWEIARHIEGNFGCPYEAILVCRDGLVNIYTPKNDRWWNAERRSELSNYLMGLRSLLDLLK